MPPGDGRTPVLQLTLHDRRQAGPGDRWPAVGTDGFKVREGGAEGMAKSGPKTEAGKKIVSLNAVKHGVFSTTRVIPGIEREEDWQEHRAGILGSCAPEDYLEEALTERIAHLLWNLRRVARYETESIALAQEQIEDTWWVVQGPEQPGSMRAEAQYYSDVLLALECLPELPDDQPLSGDNAASILYAVARQAKDVNLDDFSLPGVSNDQTPEEFDGWTAGLVREGLAAIAANECKDWSDLLARALEKAYTESSAKQFKVERMEKDLDRMSRERLLPDDKTLEKVMRYEAHLNRQFNQTLHELEARQVRRQGGVAPLARLDVQGLPDA